MGQQQYRDSSIDVEATEPLLPGETTTTTTPTKAPRTHPNPILLMRRLPVICMTLASLITQHTGHPRTAFPIILLLHTYVVFVYSVVALLHHHHHQKKNKENSDRRRRRREDLVDLCLGAAFLGFGLGARLSREWWANRDYNMAFPAALTLSCVSAGFLIGTAIFSLLCGREAFKRWILEEEVEDEESFGSVRLPTN